MIRPGWPAILLTLAHTAFLHAQADPCNRALSEALQKDGRRAMAARDFQAAAQRFSDAFDACPEQRSSLLDAVEALTAARRFDDAIHAANQFLGMEPGSVPGRLALANAYLMAVRLKEALAEAERV